MLPSPNCQELDWGDIQVFEFYCFSSISPKFSSCFFPLFFFLLFPFPLPQLLLKLTIRQFSGYWESTFFRCYPSVVVNWLGKVVHLIQPQITMELKGDVRIHRLRLGRHSNLLRRAQGFCKLGKQTASIYYVSR